MFKLYCVAIWCWHGREPCMELISVKIQLRSLLAKHIDIIVTNSIIIAWIYWNPLRAQNSTVAVTAFTVFKIKLISRTVPTTQWSRWSYKMDDGITVLLWFISYTLRTYQRYMRNRNKMLWNGHHADRCTATRLSCSKMCIGLNCNAFKEELVPMLLQSLLLTRHYYCY